MIDLILVKAKFKILTEDEGGKRKTAVISGYRPDHIFEFSPDGTFMAFMGDISFIGNEPMYPGDEAEVVVRFIKRERIEKYIQVGRKWFINEGSAPIGEGTIIELLS